LSHPRPTCVTGLPHSAKRSRKRQQRRRRQTWQALVMILRDVTPRLRLVRCSLRVVGRLLRDVGRIPGDVSRVRQEVGRIFSAISFSLFSRERKEEKEENCCYEE
jgi:hypothetical protein